MLSWVGEQRTRKQERACIFRNTFEEAPAALGIRNPSRAIEQSFTGNVQDVSCSSRVARRLERLCENETNPRFSNGM